MMQLNDSAELFLEHMKNMHTVARLPYCLMDGDFRVIWCNDAAREAFPPLALPDGARLLLKDYELRDIRDEIAEEGRFTLALAPGNLFSKDGLVIYAAPPDCGTVYVLQARGIPDEGTGLRPQGLPRSIASFESHYRAPLTSIFSALSLLKQQMEREKRDDPKFAEYVSRIGQSSMELMRATRMVADYTRLSNGLHPKKPQYLDVFAFLEEHCRLAADAFASTGIGFTWDVPKQPVFTLTEQEPLHFIFCQLVSNAGRFSKPGGTIHVKARAEGGKVVLTVEDQGCGMPPDVQKHIFEPYYSYSPDGAPFAGNGLGLSIALESAGFLGGELSCVSEPGRGSTFRLSFPIRDEEGADEFTARSPEDSLDLASSMRVLLSDCIHCENP